MDDHDLLVTGRSKILVCEAEPENVLSYSTKVEFPESDLTSGCWLQGKDSRLLVASTSQSLFLLDTHSQTMEESYTCHDLDADPDLIDQQQNLNNLIGGFRQIAAISKDSQTSNKGVTSESDQIQESTNYMLGFDPNSCFVSASRSGVHIWDSGLNMLQELCDYPATHVACGKECIAAGLEEECVNIWTSPSCDLLEVEHAGTLTALSCSQLAPVLALGTSEIISVTDDYNHGQNSTFNKFVPKTKTTNLVKCFDVAACEELYESSQRDSEIISVCFSPCHAGFMLYGCKDGYVHFSDFRGKKSELKSIDTMSTLLKNQNRNNMLKNRNHNMRYLSSLAYSSDGIRVACGFSDSTVLLYDLRRASEPCDCRGNMNLEDQDLDDDEVQQQNDDDDNYHFRGVLTLAFSEKKGVMDLGKTKIPESQPQAATTTSSAGATTASGLTSNASKSSVNSNSTTALTPTPVGNSNSMNSNSMALGPVSAKETLMTEQTKTQSPAPQTKTQTQQLQQQTQQQQAATQLCQPSSSSTVKVGSSKQLPGDEQGGGGSGRYSAQKDPISNSELLLSATRATVTPNTNNQNLQHQNFQNQNPLLTDLNFNPNSRVQNQITHNDLRSIIREELKREREETKKMITTVVSSVVKDEISKALKENNSINETNLNAATSNSTSSKSMTGLSKLNSTNNSAPPLNTTKLLEDLKRELIPSTMELLAEQQDLLTKKIEDSSERLESEMSTIAFDIAKQFTDQEDKIMNAIKGVHKSVVQNSKGIIQQGVDVNE